MRFAKAQSSLFTGRFFEMALLSGEQGSPVLHGFGHMRDLHRRGSCQIGNRAGHFQAAVNAAA